MNAPRIGNASQGLNQRRHIELESRRQAQTILQPGEVSGGLSPARLLQTTLGGVLRPITSADLKKFKATVANLGNKARQGLTAKEALSLSTAPSITRAKTEIMYSLPVRLQAGKVHLVTNSGPQSKVTRHHVSFEFIGYAAALARPGTAAQSALWLTKESALRFSCDCESFRYTLRYIATAGGWVEGRAEHGYPKLTNPTLNGACCKHLIRVMVDLQSSIGLRQRIAQMIEADRGRVDKPGKAKPKVFMVSQADAERMLPKNARRITAVRPEQRGIELPKLTTNQKQIAALMAKLQSRPDITADALQRALKHVLKTSPRTSL